MKKTLGFNGIAGIMLALLLLLSPPAFAQAKPGAAPQAKSSKISDVYEALSRIRVYIEFYYMESGDYPESLDVLEGELNSLLPRELESIKFPKDPATGKPFVYTRGADGKTYALSAPDPSKYGDSSVSFTNVPWGGFTAIAEERKLKFIQALCAENLKTLATAIEYYATDNKGKFPQKLKDLIPKYIKSMPVCPVTGKLYEYKLEGENYTIKAPDPSVYKLKELFFSSNRGLVAK